MNQTKNEPEVNIEEWLSPHGLKMIVDSSPKYKKAYGSFAFGLIHKIKAKWMYVLIAGIVIFVIILYLTGAVNFGGK
jgi:hypothetical protein